jgi:transmembrane sensor
MKSSVSAEGAHAHRRKARAEASAWVVQLHGSARSAALEAAFRAWLAADPEHRREFERVNQVWLDVPEVPLGGITRLAHWNRPRVISRWAIAAVVLFVLGIGAIGVYQAWFAGVYITGVGEQRTLRLQDGTRLTLNSNSKVVVRFAKARRHVTLARGEAYFEVVHNQQRPFIVTVGDHDIRDVGTVFMVRYGNGNAAITLLEGEVTVSNAIITEAATARAGAAAAMRGETQVIANGPGSRSSIRAADPAGSAGSGAIRQIGSGDSLGATRVGGAQLVTLVPGERLLLPAGEPARLDEPNIDVVTAWRRGEVVLERTRLDDAIAEMNAYEIYKLVITSPEVGGLRISGIYHVGDGAGFAATVADLYHLRVIRAHGEILISAPPLPDVTSQPRP